MAVVDDATQQSPTPSLHVTQEQGASYVVEVSSVDNEYTLEITSGVAYNQVVVTPEPDNHYTLIVTPNITENTVQLGGSGGGGGTPGPHTHTHNDITDFDVEVNALIAAAATGGEANVQVDWDETDALDDAFILNKPFVPEELDDLTNVNTTGLSTGDVLRWSGSSWGADTPVSGDANVQSDWNETDAADDAFILNKPTLFDGDYNSLSNLPTLFDGAYSSLTGIPSTFTPAAHTHVVADITDFPTLFDGDYNSLTNLPTLFDGAYSSLTGVPSTFTPSAHTHAISEITGLQTALDSKLEASDLTGYATETYVDTAVADLVDSAPGTLDTLNELAAALGDDPNFATTVTNSLAGKAPLSHTHVAADITDFDTEVSNNTSVAANTAKVTFPGFGTTAGTALEGNTALFSGAYADLTGLPTLFSGSYNDLTDTPTLFDGAYSSLTGIPSTFAPSAHTHTASEITDFDTEVSNNTAVAANTAKVTFPGFGTTAGTALEGNTALFDGDYNSLTNLPTLFDGDYNSLTNLPTLFDGAYSSLTGTPDLTTYVPYTGASSTVNLNSQDLSGVSTITATGALFGTSPSNLRAFNVRGTGFDGRLSLQGGSGDNPGIEMTTDGNTTRVLQRLQEVGTSGTSLETYTQVDGGAISIKTTLDDDGTLYFHTTSSKNAGIRNNSGTMQFLNNGGSWTDLGTGGDANVQADWNESDSASDAFILNKPTLFDGAYSSLTGIPSTFTPAAHTHVIADVTNLQTSLDAAANVQVDWDETDPAADAFILNKPTVPVDLEDLSNVTSTTPTTGDVLRWNGTSWNADAPTGGSSTQSDWDETDSASDAFILNKPTAVADLQNHFVTANLATEYLHSGASVMDFDYTTRTQVLNLTAQETIGTAITYSSDQFNINADGLYTFTATAHWNTVGIQRAQPTFFFYINGVEQEGAGSSYIRNSGGAIDDSSNFTRTFNLTSGDVVTVYCENLGSHTGTAVRARSMVFEAFMHEMTVTGIEGSIGEENVQADWNETDSANDAFIRNKPTVPSSVDDLTDVDTTTSAPSVGDVLEWDGSNWTPATPSGGGGGGTTVHTIATYAGRAQWPANSSTNYWYGDPSYGSNEDVLDGTQSTLSGIANYDTWVHNAWYVPDTPSTVYCKGLVSNSSSSESASYDIHVELWRLDGHVDGEDDCTLTLMGSDTIQCGQNQVKSFSITATTNLPAAGDMVMMTMRWGTDGVSTYYLKFSTNIWMEV